MLKFTLAILVACLSASAVIAEPMNIDPVKMQQAQVDGIRARDAKLAAQTAATPAPQTSTAAPAYQPGDYASNSTRFKDYTLKCALEKSISLAIGDDWAKRIDAMSDAEYQSAIRNCSANVVQPQGQREARLMLMPPRAGYYGPAQYAGDRMLDSLGPNGHVMEHIRGPQDLPPGARECIVPGVVGARGVPGIAVSQRCLRERGY